MSTAGVLHEDLYISNVLRSKIHLIKFEGITVSNITINGITIDPISQNASLQDAGLSSENSASSNHILIQTETELTQSQREELSLHDVSIEEYVSPNTYLAYFTPQELSKVRALSFVTWADIYPRIFKISPTLLPQSANVRDILSLADPTPHPNRTRREVDIVLHLNEHPTDELVSHIAEAARVGKESVAVGRSKFRVTAPLDALPKISNFDEVREIQPVPQRKLFNNIARKLIKADVLVNGTNYRGSGEVVAIADTGFDKGSIHDTHAAFTGRVLKIHALGRVAPALADDPDGHGTHVAGSVLGTINSSEMGGAIEGTAPEASLVFQSILDGSGGLGGIPFDLNTLFQQAYDDGARVHTNSWGVSGISLPYDTSASEIDEFVWENPDCVICFAAGNDGTDSNQNGVVDSKSIGSQSSAKNCITVGASESIRDDFVFSYGQYWPANFPSPPVSTDKQADSAQGMAAFSSRGPTREGRLKPDLVAPGTCILSALSRNASMLDVFGTSTDDNLMFLSGTSMATPLVAGCAAVVRESLIKNSNLNPSAALIKTLLINGASSLDGQYNPSEAGSSPNGNSGWGLVNLRASVLMAESEGVSGFFEGGSLEEGHDALIEIQIPSFSREDMSLVNASAGRALKVTLSWSDPPGVLLQNDLDLIIRASDGFERHGNMGQTQEFDRTNNVEQINWIDIPAGIAQIIVRSHRITRFAQPFAVAWSFSA